MNARLDSIPRIGQSCARKAAEPVALPPSVHRLLPFRALPSAQTISQNSLHLPDGPDLPAMVLIDAGPRFLARASFAQLVSRERKQRTSGATSM